MNGVVAVSVLAVLGEAAVDRYAFVTLVDQNPAYILGARVLAQSLRRVNSAHPLVSLSITCPVLECKGNAPPPNPGYPKVHKVL